MTESRRSQHVDDRTAMATLRWRTLVLLDFIAVIAFTALLAPLLLRLARGISTPAAAFGALGCALLGYLLADVASGIVHWFCDRFLEEDTPLLGPLVIVPFRDHHRDPRAMTRHGFLELSGNSCLAVVPLLALVLAWPLAVWGDAAFAAFASAALITNLAHGWAHTEDPPRLVRLLQVRGLLLRAADHASHHAPGHRGAYCVLNGWANSWLDRAGVFARGERVLVGLGVPAAREP